MSTELGIVIFFLSLITSVVSDATPVVLGSVGLGFMIGSLVTANLLPENSAYVWILLISSGMLCTAAYQKVFGEQR